MSYKKDEVKAQQRKDDSGLLTVHEVATELRVDDTTVRRWIKNGAMEAITLPHARTRMAYRVKKETLDALLNEPATRKQAS